jgi:uncharacterized protein
MMRRPQTSSLALAILAACLVSTSCADSQPTRFYTLAPLAEAPPREAMPALPSDLTLGVGPVTLPPYLDRPQLVTRAGSNRVVLADFDSWAEPLDGLFARVLAENLAILLGTDDVLLLPQRRPVPLDYQVEVDVTRFVDTSGNAALDARWWCSIGMARSCCGAAARRSPSRPVSATIPPLPPRSAAPLAP